MSNRITIIQGGQAGSEAKGAIAAYLCRNGTPKYDYAVRTGATNAGHTCYYNGVPFKAQQLPVGFVHPDTVLVVGAGALIDPDILAREVAEISRLTGRDVRERLKIDRRAGLHFPAHAARSKASGRHHSIGATGKGCSEAIIDRIRNRNADAALFGNSPWAKDYDVCDTEALLNFGWNEGAKIMLEGTQGQLLDLYLGPYPYTTHKQTGPAQWMLECGLSPSLPTEIVLVVRTFPIRVAGNSGPLANEISWPMLAREMNQRRAEYALPPLVREETLLLFEKAVIQAGCSQCWMPAGRNGLDQHLWSAQERLNWKEALSELNRVALESLPPVFRTELESIFEMTTVTKKLRRVARLSLDDLRISARQARPAWVALTFMNYLEPENWFSKTARPSESSKDLIIDVERACRASVGLVSYGPDDCHVRDLRTQT